MIKKLLFMVFCITITTITFGQGPSNPIITLTESSYTLADNITFTLTYSGDEITVANAVLATRNVSGGGFAEYDSKSINTIVGTSSGTNISLSRVPRSSALNTSAELLALPTPREHVLYIQYRTTVGGTTNYFGTSAVVTLTAAPIPDKIIWNPDNAIYSSSTTMDVGITYNSDTDIAVGGLQFTMWTITSGTYNFPSDSPDLGDVSMFSDIWYGVFSNGTILPATAGADVSTVITINVPASVMNGGKMRPSTDLGAIWDPNAGDAGNNYVNHATSPAPQYYYQFRSIAGTDPNFAPLTYPQTAFTVSATAGIKDYEKLKITVKPNPTSKNISIGNKSDEISLVEIYDVTGRKVKSFDHHLNMDVSNLKPGLYLLKTDTGRLSKFIKE